ncbi:hypothetical protein QBC40DRAFT_308499 [Triangularia verruculosa]|uniref:Uncharacterized protein n=1 Tax=Triangularia verruculosa TaxID=2587418 RepID=A0AAN7AT61_9PEZI|nr:hypothetical protein QBC40DRAFT_308499 [Triangularia verruculosa]
MRWHAWKGCPCQRIFFHRAISSSFANRRAMRTGGPTEPTTGGAGRGALGPSMSLTPTVSLYSTTHHAPSTEYLHMGLLSALEALQPPVEPPSHPRHDSLPWHSTRRNLGNLTAVPPLALPVIARRLPVRVVDHHYHHQRQRHPSAAAGPDPPTQQEVESRQRGGYMALLPSVSCLSGPGFLTLKKGPTLGTLRGLCTELPLTLCSRPADLPVCLPVIHNTYSYSGAAACPGSPPWPASMSSSPPLLACPALLCVRVAPYDLILLQLLI